MTEPRNKTGLSLLAVLLVASQLSGCVGSPRYARYSDAEGSKVTRLDEPVEYRINAEVDESRLDCVAILPLAISEEAAGAIELPKAEIADSSPADEAEPEAYLRHFEAADKQRLVRRMLYGFISPHPQRDVELARIDRLAGAPPYGRAAQRQLGKQLGCDWLMLGTITQFDIDYLGLYSNIRIGVDLKLVRASSGQVLWSGRHLAQSRDGEVPLSPVGLAMSVVKAATNLEPDQLEGVAADLARRLVRTMPLEDSNVFLLAAKRRHIYEVVAKRLNMRTGPGVHYDVRRVLLDNQQVAVLEASAEGWCRVRTPDGDTGFVAARYLRETSGDRGS